MQTSGFFDAMEVGNGQYDREYVAAQFAKYFSLFVGNGVFLQTANALQVVSAGDMNIIMHAGAAFANGYWYLNDNDYTYAVPINTESTARYDSVVIAFDTVERTAEMRYKVNDISVVREDEIYELQIAQVVVNAGTVEITDAYIIDKRPDESVCGFVKGLVEVLTTNELFNQFNAQFEEWFDVIKGQLSEDAAGNLQLQVDERVLKSNVVKTAEEIENGTDEEKVAGILAIKGLLQKINNSINERVLKSKVLSQLALVIKATSEEEVAGALAVKELNSDVIELNQNLEDVTVRFKIDINTTNLGATSLENAISLLCDNLPDKESFFSGRFTYNSLGYHYFMQRTAIYYSGYFNCISGSDAYSFRRIRGADAVLKKLGSGFTGIVGFSKSGYSNFSKTMTLQAGTYTASGYMTNDSVNNAVFRVTVDGTNVVNKTITGASTSAVISQNFTISKESSVTLTLNGAMNGGLSVGGIYKIADL